MIRYYCHGLRVGAGGLNRADIQIVLAIKGC